MSRTAEQHRGVGVSTGAALVVSQGIEWLWHHLSDITNPHVLDCGPASPSTIRILLDRQAKFYSADLITSLYKSDPTLWDRSGKTPVFLADKLLTELPLIPEGSLSAILSWNLLDLTPHEGLQRVVNRLFGLLRPLGILFAVLHEPQHKTGVESRWWLEALSSPRSEADGQKAFPYGAVTNREIERLLPAASIKTFLTRSGRREILAMRRP